MKENLWLKNKRSHGYCTISEDFLWMCSYSAARSIPAYNVFSLYVFSSGGSLLLTPWRQHMRYNIFISTAASRKPFPYAWRLAICWYDGVNPFHINTACYVQDTIKRATTSSCAHSAGGPGPILWHTVRATIKEARVARKGPDCQEAREARWHLSEHRMRRK